MGNEYNMRINKGKTTVIVNDKEGESTVQVNMNGDTTLQAVKECKYIRSGVT